LSEPGDDNFRVGAKKEEEALTKKKSRDETDPPPTEEVLPLGGNLSPKEKNRGREGPELRVSFHQVKTANPLQGERETSPFRTC